MGQTQGTSWLCPAEADRARLLDMERRIKPVRAAAMGILGAALIASGPWVGWWPVLVLLVSLAAFAVVDRGIEKAPRPEYRMAAGWALSQLLIAGSIVLSDGLHSPALCWLAIPVVTLSSRFSNRGVAAGLVLTIGLLLAVTIGLDHQAVMDDPSNLIFALGAIGAVGMLTTPLMVSDQAHRSDARIDALTGLLNRHALELRIAELEMQADGGDVTIGVIVADLDHFKAVNDAHGHATGDDVLRGTADRLRTHGRAFELIYRIGGEEFLVLLPGASLQDTIEHAEALRCAVGSRPIGDVPVTISCGVSASEVGAFDFQRVFGRADAALYEAKQAGRDQVRVRTLDDAATALARTAA
ncbi:diguanylate cyclase [Svornostia abyssi]|uniref:Diguanylate cyclase n=1 Tax=Svornostia abyssi TaxID=2898438 RepID=A0ABY5PGX8_9ACTN|nr:diguanylate cyclase [Parviterribacteraceae bacterium J379]